MRERVSFGFIVDFFQHLCSFHALPITNDCPAPKTLCIGPIRVAKPGDTICDVIYVEYPISAKRLAKALAFHNKLLASALRVLLVLVKKDPLKIWAFVFTRDARFVIGVRLIVAF